MATNSDSSRKRRSDSVVVARYNHDISEPSVADCLSGSDHLSNKVTTVASAMGDLSSATSQTVVRLKVRMKRFHGVAAWSWNANDDVCGICQSAFEGTAPGVKYPGEDCPVVWGKCGHAYHLQCVSKWLSQPSSKNSCPICRQEWEFGQNPINTDNSRE